MSLTHLFQDAYKDLLEWPTIVILYMGKIGSFSKDNGNDNARKLWSDWLNEEKYLCCMCGTHFGTIFLCGPPSDNMKYSKFTALMITWTHNSKSFILCKYLVQRRFYLAGCYQSMQSMIDDDRWQSMAIDVNRLILVIDEHDRLKFCDYRLSSIINSNR